MNTKLRRDDLVLPELSYVVMGCVFDVFKQLGHGHDEKTYQKALAVLFEKKKISFIREYYAPITFEGRVVKKRHYDFLIENKMILELKKTNVFNRANIEQVLRYLKQTELPLAILANFGKDQVYYKRIPHLR